MVEPRPLEEHDLVAVTVKQVEYYGYITSIDWDVRYLSVRVEFFPGEESTFDMSEVKRVTYPEPKP
jgi:hypothetical protein